MKCSQCGADVKWGEKYCTFCGHEMNGIFNIEDDTNNEDDFWDTYKSSDDFWDTYKSSDDFLDNSNSDRFNNKIDIKDVKLVDENFKNEDLADEILKEYKGNTDGWKITKNTRVEYIDGMDQNINDKHFNATPKVSNYINAPIKTTGTFIFCIIEMLFLSPLFGFIGLILYMTLLKPFAIKGDVEKTKKYKKYVTLVLWLGVLWRVFFWGLILVMDLYNFGIY